MKFNTDKFEVLHLGRLVNSSTKKADSQQYTLTVKKKKVMDAKS